MKTNFYVYVTKVMAEVLTKKADILSVLSGRKVERGIGGKITLQKL